MSLEIGTIGGGLAGLFTTLKLLNSGCEAEVFEEHRSIGYPKHCTGLVSESTLKMLGFEGKKCADAFFNEIEFVFPGKGSILFRPKYRIAHLDRVCLERSIAEAVLEKGGKINLGKRAVLSGDRVIKAGESSKTFDHILVAEGVRMSISGKLLSKLKRSKKIFGLNMVIRAKNDLEGITVGFEPNIAPGFFYWLLPLSDEKVLVGVGTEKPKFAEKSLEAVMRIHGIRYVWIEEKYGGWIGLGPPAARQRIASITFIGDSFGLQKPLTGGGIYPIAKSAALIGGRECQEAIIQLRKNTEEVSRELRRQLKLAKFAHSRSFYYITGKFLMKVGGIELKDDEGLIDYDRHELIIRNVFFNFADFIKEVNLKSSTFKR